MIIECPACATRYVVPDTAIGVEGRTVRCAKCRHSWFQDGADAAAVQAATTAAPTPADDVAEAAPAPPAESPAAEVPETDAAPAQGAETGAEVAEKEPSPVETPAMPPPPVQPISDDVEFSRFESAPPFRPRRNWLKLWTWMAAIFAALVAAAIFAVSYWGLPDWVPIEKPDFAPAQEDLVFDFPRDQQEKREMPGGIEYFAVNGTITNTGSSARDVPPLLIQLRDDRDRIVFDWEITPPKRALGPGESMAVTEAVTDVPRAASSVRIGWKAE